MLNNSPKHGTVKAALVTIVAVCAFIAPSTLINPVVGLIIGAIGSGCAALLGYLLQPGTIGKQTTQDTSVIDAQQQQSTTAVTAGDI